MWTSQSLYDLIREKLKDCVFIVVSNREPYVHSFKGEEIIWNMPASGLTMALDPVMQASRGVWVAHGSGNADRKVTDKKGHIQVPPDSPSYTLRRLWLTQEQEEGYYKGFSNEALWPLCHIVYTRPAFNEYDWRQYQKVNSLFADAVLEEVGDRKAFIFIQDYHMALVARYIKERCGNNNNIITALFWHIPWPNVEVFRICPWHTELVEGLLANDLLGFQIQYHCLNFLDTVNRLVEALIDQENQAVIYKGKKVAVRVFPISIDFEAVNRMAQQPEIEEEITRLQKQFGLNGDEIIGIGIDRYDYTKGIPDRLKAIELFLKNHHQYAGKFVFIQAGVASRESIEAYQNTNHEIDRLIERINQQFGIGSRKPVICLRENLPQRSLMALRRMSRFCIVSSLHDGMNLVAKEYVASRFDETGVLILSRFTGAARELTDALLINPYATYEFAETIKTAIKMPLEEQRRRIRKMREIVQENNIYKWAADIITELVRFEFGR